ncbi:hypothetical protein [Streptomyces sp. NPDC052496]|uniref:hypothetical protein n=1 Tax=Streptomyces sp. NPDC052496 TaxID=3154951 RepID=UPI00341451C7
MTRAASPAAEQAETRRAVPRNDAPVMTGGGTRVVMKSDGTRVVMKGDGTRAVMKATARGL